MSRTISLLQAFSEAVARIHQTTGMDQFPHKVFEAIQLLFPDTVISLDEFNTKTGISRSIANRTGNPGDEWSRRLRELVPIEHPVFPVVSAGHRDPLQIGDFLTEREFRKTALYNDVFRPLGALHQIVLPLGVPDHVSGLTISRLRRFREEDVAIVRMLGSHIVQAHVHAQRFTALLGQQTPSLPDIRFLQREGVTAREAQVLQWIVQGKRDAEIATLLGISVRTIEKHVQRLLQKLGVENRTAAASRAMEMGLTSGLS